MRPIQIKSEVVIKLFENSPVLTMQQLTTELKCSHMTVFRKLYKLHYFSSYSHKGKYYALSRTAQFNDNGLWEYQGIRFSLYGSLKNTVRQFVTDSQAGYSAEELDKLLSVRVYNTLLDLVSEKQIERDFYERKYIYFSVDQATKRLQQEQRKEILLAQTDRIAAAQSKKVQLPEDQDVIRILVHMIQHPDQEPKFIAKELAQGGKSIDEATIMAVWEHYDLKKKTN